MPPFILDKNHPLPTGLDLKWSYLGEWVKVPSSTRDRGPNYRETYLARIEVYVDLEGKVRKALCYGEEADSLRTWFNLEEMKAAFPHWVIPNPCPYYNTRRFNPASIRKGLLNNNQSRRDFQSGRGRNRSKYGGNQNRSREDEYNEWDRQQSRGKDKKEEERRREQESWEEYQAVKEEEKRRVE